MNAETIIVLSLLAPPSLLLFASAVVGVTDAIRDRMGWW